jgi:pimeloyl-ACP methyl ester carboxylesterase
MEASFTERVISTDGTPIAYQRFGAGPALILVGGGLDDGSETVPLVPVLGRQFTVYNYARRGRGASGDTPPYTLKREFEDLDALIKAAGGSAHLFGVSSGGALALEAAAAGIRANRIAVYEVPYNMAEDWPGRWRTYANEVEAAIQQNRRGDAIELFLRLTGSSEEEVAGVRSSPFWPALETIAHTLPYDAACLGNGQPPAERFARISQPTLVLTGDRAGQPDAAAWVLALPAAADAVAASIPNAQRATLEGQGHVADPEAIATVLESFLSGS